MATDWPYLAIHDADGNLLLPLTVDLDTDPFLVTAFDAGAVDVRDDSEDDEAGDGTDDRTEFSGGAGVTAELTAYGTPGRRAGLWLDDLRALCSASTRAYMHLQTVDWPHVRRLLVRGASAPRDYTDPQPDVQFQWKALLGYFEDVDWSFARLGPSGVTTTGLSEPVSDPVYTPPADSDDGAPIIIGGDLSPGVASDNLRPWWELDIYGPCSGPAVTSAAGWQVAGKASLVIADGHFVRITPKTPSGPTVFADADPLQDFYGQIDFGRTTWERLAIGRNVLTLTAKSSGPGFRAELRWRARHP